MSCSSGTISPGFAERVWSALAPYAERPVVVAFSGGVDSTVLLHLLVSFREKKLISSLSALHIHHGLSANANAWAEHCRNVCHQWQVPVQVDSVDVGGGSGDGIEQAARVLRYERFEHFLPEGGCLLQGHHRDDQAETLLFRLFRGSGLDGLAGIPNERALGGGLLLRPLLDSSRMDIEAYATGHSLVHIEDESNQDQRFARNYLRQSLIPEIEQRWPGVSGRLAQLTQDVKESNRLIQGSVTDAAKNVLKTAPDYWNAGAIVDIQGLQVLPGDMSMRVVRYWLGQKKILMPDRKTLNTLFDEVVDSRHDADPQLRLGQYCLRRFDGFLVLVPNLSPFAADVLHWNWGEQDELIIPGSGVLTLNKSVDGFRAEVSESVEASEPVVVLFRSNLPSGERCRVVGRSGSKSIKRWLQDYKVPPWLRDRVPFLYQEGEMLGAAGLWWCETRSKADSETYSNENKGMYDVFWRFDPYADR